MSLFRPLPLLLLGWLIACSLDLSAQTSTLQYAPPNQQYRVQYGANDPLFETDCQVWQQRNACGTGACDPGYRLLWEFGDGNYTITTAQQPCVGGNPLLFRAPLQATWPCFGGKAYPNGMPPQVELHRIYTPDEPPASTLRLGGGLPSPLPPNCPGFVGQRPAGLRNFLHWQMPNRVPFEDSATAILTLTTTSENDDCGTFQAGSGIDLFYDPGLIRIDPNRIRHVAAYGLSTQLVQPGHIVIRLSNLPAGGWVHFFIPLIDRAERGRPTDFRLDAVASLNSSNCGTITPRASIKALISGSNDPNYKAVDVPCLTCSPQAKRLAYTLHFENIGDGPVVDRIRIRDTIPDKLVFSSLRLDSATLAGVPVDPSRIKLLYANEAQRIVEWELRRDTLEDLASSQPGWPYQFLLDGLIQLDSQSQDTLSANHALTVGELFYAITTTCNIGVNDSAGLNAQAQVFFDNNCQVVTVPAPPLLRKCITLVDSNLIPITNFAPYLRFGLDTAARLDTVIIVEPPQTGALIYEPVSGQLQYDDTASSNQAKIVLVNARGLADTLCLSFCDDLINCECERNEPCQEPIGSFADVGTQPFANPAGCAATNLPDPAERQDLLRVYPNPTRRKLQVESVPTPPPTWLTLYHSNGQQVRRVRHASSGQTTLDLQGLPPGLYLLRRGEQQARVLLLP